MAALPGELGVLLGCTAFPETGRISIGFVFDGSGAEGVLLQ